MPEALSTGTGLGAGAVGLCPALDSSGGLLQSLVSLHAVPHGAEQRFAPLFPQGLLDVSFLTVVLKPSTVALHLASTALVKADWCVNN